MRRGTRPLLAVLALALVFSSVAAVSLYPLGWDKDSLPANADALYCSWAVAWIARTLPHAPSEVFAANILHPDPAPLAYNDPMLAVGALAVPIYALTGSSVTTYNATLILTLALSALTMFLLGRELSGSAWAGVIAGASFAFTTANYDSLARIQVISSQWTPLSLFFLVRTLRSRRWRDGMGCGLAFALQGLACSYYEAFFAVLLLAAFPVFLAVTPRPRVRQFPWGPLVGGAALAASLLLPVNLIQHRQLSRVESARSEAQTATLDNYLAADPGNWIHARVFGASGLGYDARYFPGLIPVALALVGTLVMLRRRRDLPESSRYVIPIAWLGLFALALALGDRVSTPWGDVPGPLAALRPWVPGLAETRVPARFVMFARVAMSALAAMGAAALLRALRARPRLAVSTGLVLALAVPLEHLSTPIDTWRVPVGEAVPPVYRWLAEQPEVAVVEFPPFPVRRRREETLWLHLSALHWQRIANGYASFYPAHYDLFVNTLLDLPSPLAFEMLRVMQVEMVVFHPRAREDAEGQRATRRLDAALPELLGSQLEEVASFVEGEHAGSADRLGVLGGERVFRVLPRESPRPERRRLTPESRYSRAGWRCEATTPGCELTLDGQPDTHFVTGSPQLAGDHLRVLFPRPLVVRGVSLASGRWSQFYPVEAKLLALFDGHWELVPHRENRLEFLQDLLRDPWHASLEMHLRQPMTVSGLEIRLGHGSAFNPWIVPELYVHR